MKRMKPMTSMKLVILRPFIPSGLSIPLTGRMKTSAAGFLVVVTALLAGCESLSPAECATASWRDLGLQDGGRGELDRAADYFESCSKAKVAVDVNAYRAARAEGLQSYCRPANALSEGLAGRSYRSVCPPPLDQSFKSIYDIAWRAQDTSATLARLQRQQDQMQAELTSSKTANDRKVTLRDLLNRSDRQIRDARNAQRDAETQLDRMRLDMQRRGVL